MAAGHAVDVDDDDDDNDQNYVRSCKGFFKKQVLRPFFGIQAGRPSATQTPIAATTNPRVIVHPFSDDDAGNKPQQ